jgi:hypothetical protein
MAWGKARCPECGQVFDQWDGQATDGSGGITFEDGNVELGDIIVTSATLTCPNPKCHFRLENASCDELEEWFQMNRVDDEKESD